MKTQQCTHNISPLTLHLAEQLKLIIDRVDCCVKVKTNKRIVFWKQIISDEVMNNKKLSFWGGEGFTFKV